MNNEITGKLIVKNDTVQVNDTFKKREFVLETSETNNAQTYTETILFQCVQDRVNLLDSVSIGDTITVGFNIRGNKWEKEGKVRYFNNLDAWRITSENAGSADNSSATPDVPPGEDDLPF